MRARVARALMALALVCAVALQGGVAAAAAARLAGLPGSLTLLCSGANAPDDRALAGHDCDCAALCAAVASPPPRAPAIAPRFAQPASRLAPDATLRRDARSAGEPRQARAPPSAD